MAGLMLKRRKLRHGLDRTKCRGTKISEHSCNECGRADLREVFVGVPTSKRSQVDEVQYPSIPSRILKEALNKEVVDYVVAEVGMFDGSR
jgi:coenzyme F420-reducing hydrogenase beta subunit